MLTVIFGAGASYDSNPSHPSIPQGTDNLISIRPPLAKDLFNEKYGVHAQRNLRAQALFTRLRRASPNIEQELQVINEEIVAGYTRGASHLLSLRFYIKEVIHDAEINWRNNYIHDISTYHDLLSILDRWQTKSREKVNLITFNYDTLLDLACSSVLGMNLTTMNSYVQADSPYKIFKVHGSVNWHHMVQNTKNDIMASAANLVWTRKFFTDNEERGSFVETAYVPAIAIPTVTKTTFEFPQTHQDLMIKTIPETTKLLIIGWRGAERHFLNLWKNSSLQSSLTRVQIVNTSEASAHEVYEKVILDSGMNCPDSRISAKGFSQFVPSELVGFLS